MIESIAKGMPNMADTISMSIFSVLEVASRIGISPRRVRAIALDHAIGRIVGGARIFMEAEIEEVRWYTRRGGHRADGTKSHTGK